MKAEDNYYEITQWLNHPRNVQHIHDKPLASVSNLLQNCHTLETCGMIAFEMGFYKYWMANEMLANLFIGTKIDIHKSVSNTVDYYFFSVRIPIFLSDNPQGQARVSLMELMRLFFMLLAFNRHEHALWLGERAYLGDTPDRFSGRKDEVWTMKELNEWEALGGDECGWRGVVTRLRRLIPGQKEKECSAGQLEDNPMFPYWEEKPLCGYLLRLWLVMSGQSKPEEVPQGLPVCGVYERLFQNWENLPALEQSLTDACDYHVLRSSEDGEGHYDVPEFYLRPYSVIPFEIMAYRNVRRKMGLETPWPAHPLLDSPFVKNLPDELPPSDDPLLSDVLAAVRRVLPDV